MRCLYLTQELAPYFMEGGLGQTARALPAALEREHGIVHDLVVPYYPWLVERHSLETECVWQGPPVTVGGVDTPVRVERLLHRPGAGEVFLIRADHWYDRDGIYRDARYVEFADAVARAAYFGACVAQWVTATARRYDIVHGNDWQSGPALAHLRSQRESTSGPALLINVHNAEYPGRIGPGELRGLGLPSAWQATLEQRGPQAGLLLLGVLAADAATTGSPAYAEELRTRTGTAVGSALGTLPLTGVVAGIDTRLWQPAATGRPTEPYDAATVQPGKAANKKLLQQRLGLTEDPGIPLFGVCTRLVPEKGVDLLVEAAAPLVRDGTAQLVVVGQGDTAPTDALRSLAGQAPAHVSHVPGFAQDLAWLTYAGSDFTVMPSRVEPCGLNQLIAMTYGCVPVVSRVGGLRDTVTDLVTDPASGTGFVLPELSADALRQAMLTAARWLAGPAHQVRDVRRRIMAQDWSWARSARATAALYASTAATSRPAERTLTTPAASMAASY
ncbi:glycogen synthase [Streptomyces sp. enrichment culture]|uniref:glycogen synthase n=1 Tax=Streptomyces sp. enrichment culture TaxID=1795815 RepID=UPI003F56C09B